jgi:hypothetical protein
MHHLEDEEGRELAVTQPRIVKQQKPTRQRAGGQKSVEKKRETVRVNTDVWLIERASGEFH